MTTLSRCSLLLFCLSLSSSALASPAKPNITQPKLPLTFEKNLGQTDKSVQFLSHGNGYTLFLTPKEAVFSLQKEQKNSVLRMKLLHSNPNATATGLETQKGVVNYLRGNDSSKWQSNIPTYGKVRYSGVYRGIDLVYYGNATKLEYDFVVSPHADASQIGLRFGGAKRVQLLGNGGLSLVLGSERMEWGKPVVYQERNGKRVSIAGSYVSRGKGEVGIAVGEYDRSLPLVIDPILQYSTTFGGSKGDFAYRSVVDSKGAIYILGATASTDFPTTKGVYQNQHSKTATDIFVTKLNVDGQTIIYSTYIGVGSSYSIYNYPPTYIATDSTGCVYIGGTALEGLPVTSKAYQKKNAGYSDVFVMKLSKDGSSLIYSTYLGGSNGESIAGIAVDSSGNAYVVGNTASYDFPLTADAYQQGPWSYIDGFVTKINRDGRSLQYSTYLGGSDNDWVIGMTLDSSGCVYVVGTTSSVDYPTTEGAYQTDLKGQNDVFVTKLTASGQDIVYSTYLGGDLWEQVMCLALDTRNNLYIAGDTECFPKKYALYPITTPLPSWLDEDTGRAIFLTKLSPDGTALVYSTLVQYAFKVIDSTDYYSVIPIGMTVDSNGCTYLKLDSRKDRDGPGNDQIHEFYQSIWKINAEGTATFLTLDLARLGYVQGISLDRANNLYLTGWTSGSHGNGDVDALLAKMKFPRSKIVLSQDKVTGGETFKATIVLDGVASTATTVTLACDSNLVLLPANVVIPKGQSTVTFDVPTLTTSSDITVNLTTTPTTMLLTTPLSLLKAWERLDLDIASTLRGGMSARGNIALDRPLTLTELVVNLSSDNPLISVPASVTISPNNIGTTFDYNAGEVTKDTIVNVTATSKGVSVTKSITITPTYLSDFTLNKYTVRSKAKVIGTVTLIGATSVKDTIITLSSSDTSLANPPASATVPKGSTFATFTFNVGKVSKNTNVTITASDGKFSIPRVLTIRP